LKVRGVKLGSNQHFYPLKEFDGKTKVAAWSQAAAFPDLHLQRQQ
jgi:hypothetical protein